MVNVRCSNEGLPKMAAIRGVRRSFTNAVMSAANATPMTTATASSTTLPRSRNCLNSLTTAPPLLADQPRPKPAFRHRRRPDRPNCIPKAIQGFVSIIERRDPESVDPPLPRAGRGERSRLAGLRPSVVDLPGSALCRLGIDVRGHQGGHPNDPTPLHGLDQVPGRGHDPLPVGVSPR